MTHHVRYNMITKDGGAVMGYFSEFDVMQHEDAAWDGSTVKVQQLAGRIDDLNERFAELENRCSRDLWDPEFDRVFYSECLTEAGDDMDTMQGVMQAIRKTEELLRIAEEEEQQRNDWRNTVWETGATPDDQIVLLSAFFDLTVAA